MNLFGRRVAALVLGIAKAILPRAGVLLTGNGSSPAVTVEGESPRTP